MALSASIVWEIRSAGSANNGGGFKTGASGTDYSQQTSPQYALTTATTVFGTDPKTVLSASAATNMVGNVARVVSGTNFIVGYYEIVSVVAGVSFTCDANVCTGNGSSGVINIGGALATLDNIGSSSANQGAVAGNTIYIKADGTYSRTTNADTFACLGTTTSPIVIYGYKTTRGDGYLGRTNNNGDLITTNFPVITYTTNAFLSTNSCQIFNFLNISCNNRNSYAAIATGSNVVFNACLISNAAVGSSSAAFQATGAQVSLSNCDLTVTNNGNAGVAAIQFQNNGCVAYGCRITSTSVGVQTSSAGGAISNCVIYGCVSYGIQINNTIAFSTLFYNTIVGGSSDGINIITGTTVKHSIIGNCITDNGGYGINMVSTANGALLAYNRYRNNTSGAIGNGGAWTTVTDFGAVTSGGATSDYVNSGGNNYSLISGSPAASAAQPLYSSMGALQRPQTASASSYTTGG